VASIRRCFSEKRKADIKVIADKSFIEHTMLHQLANDNGKEKYREWRE
jgi:hypothetical protein